MNPEQIEQLANEYVPDVISDYQRGKKDGFIAGYNAAMSEGKQIPSTSTAEQYLIEKHNELWDKLPAIDVAEICEAMVCYASAEQGKQPGGGKTKIVCLCGSVRFAELFHLYEFNLSVAGYIVLTPCAFNHDVQKTNPTAKEVFDRLHLQKIDLADEVFIINKDGYIGESTRNELNYARLQNKKIIFLEPESLTP